MGKAEFLGRAIGKPNAILCEEDYKAPSLEWFQIHRGAEDAGELLAAFEMFEVSWQKHLALKIELWMNVSEPSELKLYSITA